MRKFIFLITALVAVCTVVAQPNVKIEQSKEFTKSFAFDQKDAVKEFITATFKELKEVRYLHKKVQISMKDEKTITVTVKASNTSNWEGCSQTYWNAEVPQNIRASMDQAGAEALNGLCVNNYHCVCYNQYYQDYFTDNQWSGHAYCINITVYEGTVCGCLNPAC